METIHDYLGRTASAAGKLIMGINSYPEMLMNSMRQGILIPKETEEGRRRKEFEDWKLSKEFEESIRAQDRFVHESISMDDLCGALLQLAFKGVQLSPKPESQHVPDDFSQFIKPNAISKKFCIGRYVRNVPIGLIIYAGRNRYNHFDDDEPRKLDVAIFEKLCKAEKLGLIYKDPSFDLNIKGDNTRFSSNIIFLLGWDKCSNYCMDMMEMIEE